MTESNLIPLTERSKERAKEIRSMGGKSLKGIPQYKLTHCKRCKLDCPLKEEGTKNHWRCKVPDIKRKILEAALMPESLDKAIIMNMFDLAATVKTTRDKKMLLDSLMEFRKITKPADQNININQKSVIIKVDGVDLEVEKP